ncbi:uncharacterized protein LMH87_008975 [Akanthomyces muscarius]|uniref:Zn(2)-C6 fungal-type domain-containing protein n=1 Tax=Akanthomyces muscarius TaxID=2231603 RepID=A0A9W8QJR3_AKAMU|nr:uncharacterized protein LMH87_008975 [Akanthomyces muscarius]KAJ4158449.1 hypothetical protein LMH87_008975 [Akanthomyces muscarius]
MSDHSTPPSPSSAPSAPKPGYNNAPGDALPLHLADEDRRPRQKRWTTRSRTGCLTCRARRVKCDELQPVCLQCRIANRSCVTAATPTSLVPATQQHLRPEAWGTIDVSLHQYFVAKIANIASDEFNGDFWQRSVLQVRTALPAVRHASNAVACLKWTRNARANLSHMFRQTLETESGRQYAASMKCIVDIIQSPSPSPEEKTTVLLASVFYYRYSLDWENILAIVAKNYHIQIAVLDVRHALASLLFKINLEEFGALWSETCWDRLEHDFAIVLGLIESVLTKATDPASQAYRDISYTPFLYKSLTFIARFCRSSAVRHKAAGILGLS